VNLRAVIIALPHIAFKLRLLKSAILNMAAEAAATLPVPRAWQPTRLVLAALSISN